MIWLLACQHPDEDTGVATDTSATSTAPALTSPAEAEDLDPADDVVHVALTAAETATGFAYDGQVPGPTIRARVGDTVVVDLQNDLADPTTIHWHGLAVPNDMDGVDAITGPVEPGGAFTYIFTVDRAGTYWYHPHMDTAHQVGRGLYGAFVVEDPAEPATDDLVVVWSIPEDADDGDMDADDHDHTAPDPATAAWTVNGIPEPPAAALAGGARIRMINASNTGYLALHWPGMRQIASDQGLLAAASDASPALLAPGDRADFEWTGGEADVQTALYTASGGAALGDDRTLMTLSGPAADAPAWPFSGEPPSEDPGWTDLTYVFQGGAEGEAWLIDGEAWPDVTIGHVAVGSEPIVEVRNLSASEHPFHVHGNAFEVLSVDGVAPVARTLEDTVNVPIRSTVRLKLLADNPGEWMVHCHILEHADEGMMTALIVE